MTFHYEVTFTVKNNQLVRDTGIDELARILGERLDSAIANTVAELPWVIFSEFRMEQP